MPFLSWTIFGLEMALAFYPHWEVEVNLRAVLLEASLYHQHLKLLWEAIVIISVVKGGNVGCAEEDYQS